MIEEGQHDLEIPIVEDLGVTDLLDAQMLGKAKLRELCGKLITIYLATTYNTNSTNDLLLKAIGISDSSNFIQVLSLATRRLDDSDIQKLNVIKAWYHKVKKMKTKAES